MNFLIYLNDKKENISYFELILLGYVESFRNGCYKRVDQIASDLKTNTTTIRRALKHLVEIHELFKHKTKGKHYKYTRFPLEEDIKKETPTTFEDKESYQEKVQRIIKELKEKWKKK